MIIEEWRRLNGIFSDYINYEVSNIGNVRNIKRNKILSGSFDPDGYKYVKLTGINKKQAFRIHRLVAYMFKKGSYKENFIINHINGIRDDNRVENLEWITVKENNSKEKITEQGYQNKQKAIIEINNKTRKKVYCKELDITFASLLETSKFFNTNICVIHSHCKKINKKILTYNSKIITLDYAF